MRIDFTNPQIRNLFASRAIQMRGWVCCGQVHSQSAACEFDGHGGGHRGLADASFAHEHHQPMTGSGNLVSERRERRKLTQRLGGLRFVVVVRFGSRLRKKRAKCLKADQIKRFERHLKRPQCPKPGRHRVERLLPHSLQACGQPVVRSGAEHAVDQKHLIVDALFFEFDPCPFGFRKCAALGTGYQDQSCLGLVAQRRERLCVAFLLVLQAR